MPEKRKITIVGGAGPSPPSEYSPGDAPARAGRFQ